MPRYNFGIHNVFAYYAAESYKLCNINTDTLYMGDDDEPMETILLALHPIGMQHNKKHTRYGI